MFRLRIFDEDSMYQQKKKTTEINNINPYIPWELRPDSHYANGASGNYLSSLGRISFFFSESRGLYYITCRLALTSSNSLTDRIIYRIKISKWVGLVPVQATEAQRAYTWRINAFDWKMRSNIWIWVQTIRSGRAALEMPGQSRCAGAGAWGWQLGKVE